MRKSIVVLLAITAACVVPMALAQKSELNNPLPRHLPTIQRYVVEFARSGSGGNLVYHNGPVIVTAYVVPIYWGPTWSTNTSTDPISSSLTNFIDGGTTKTTTDLTFGETHEFNVITQYYETGPTYITESNLDGAGGALYDSSPPPTNVTDADVQAEVLKMTNNSPRTDTVYEVFLPSTSFSSDGSYTSCGGPNLTYCAYHGNFSYLNEDIK